MLSLQQILKISRRKFTRNKKRSFLTILPIIFLTLIVVVISSEAHNIFSLINREFFQKIETRNTIIELTSFMSPDDKYTDSDMEEIKKINHVVAATMPTKSYTMNMAVKDLFPEKQITISELMGLNSDFATYYTDANFTYNSQVPIPIILNAAAFSYEEINWNGQDKLEVNIDIQNISDNPVKNKLIEYEKAKLIGKEITLSVGGLDRIPEYTVQNTDPMKVIYQKYTQEEIKKKEEMRKQDIAKYWNYEKIAQPQEYHCVIVAILEGDFSNRFYVPAAFVDILNQNSFDKYLEARNSVEIPQIELLSFYQGWKYDGKSLEYSYYSLNENQFVEVSYAIPGLIIEKSERTRGLPKEIREFDFKALKDSGEVILIQIDNFTNREAVVKDLNSKGYQYWDMNPEAIFLQFRKWIDRFIVIMVGIFVLISVMIILMIMGKFVDEARREIGVFRALGSTKGDIRNIYIGQAVFYMVIGLVIGLILGCLIVLSMSFQMSKWLNTAFSMLNLGIMQISFRMNYKDFLGINWLVVSGYSAALVFSTFIISLFPASKAAKVSPVEAIKNE